MSMQLRYLSTADIIGMHQVIMMKYGQAADLIEGGEAAIESAILRPRTAAFYANADLATQAVLLIAGLAQAHPFVDGNKRIALAAGTVMLELNGYYVKSSRLEFAHSIMAVLTDMEHRTERIEVFAEWIRSHMHPVGER
jgi:death-on-curing protein